MKDQLDSIAAQVTQISSAIDSLTSRMAPFEESNQLLTGLESRVKSLEDQASQSEPTPNRTAVSDNEQSILESAPPATIEAVLRYRRALMNSVSVEPLFHLPTSLKGRCAHSLFSK